MPLNAQIEEQSKTENPITISGLLNILGAAHTHDTGLTLALQKFKFYYLMEFQTTLHFLFIFVYVKPLKIFKLHFLSTSVNQYHHDTGKGLLSTGNICGVDLIC